MNFPACSELRIEIDRVVVDGPLSPRLDAASLSRAVEMELQALLSGQRDHTPIRGRTGVLARQIAVQLLRRLDA